MFNNLLSVKSYLLDIARQLETFFLQKRFLIYNHKPEMILKEDTGELKAELVRKDELIRCTVQTGEREERLHFDNAGNITRSSGSGRRCLLMPRLVVSLYLDI